MRWRHTPTFAWLLALLLVSPASVRGEVSLVVLVHASAPLDRVETKALADLFLQKSDSVPGLDDAVPLALSSGTAEGLLFMGKVLDMTEKDFKRYWAKEVFSGRRTPPREYKSPAELIDAVASNPKAVACLPGPVADPRVKVISLTP